jgi:hypothetical protein
MAFFSWSFVIITKIPNNKEILKRKFRSSRGRFLKHISDKFPEKVSSMTNLLTFRLL